MDTRRIKHFISVVEAGSIARAAVSLHIAQPALSAQMRQLEEALDCQLLTRSSKGVTPTAAGLELCRLGHELLHMFEAIQTVGRDTAAEPEGLVNVGVPASVGSMLSVPLMEALMRRYPRIELGLQEITSADLGDQLKRGRLDIAVLFDDVLGTGMRYEAVVEEDLFLLSAQRGPEEIALAKLAGIPIVMPARPNSMRLLLDKACAKRGIVPRVVAGISSPYSMLRLAEAGLCCTVLPGSMLVDRGSGLHAARIVSPKLTRTICLATNATVPGTARVSAVLELLRETLHGLVQSGRWVSARLKQPPRRKAKKLS